MRNLKCKRCGIKTPEDEIYRIIHITKSGNEQKRNYCTEECYKQEQQDIYMLKQCQYFVDETLGYVCVNNAKNSNIKEICNAGYSREELFNCMLELKETILDSLNYRQDIESEYQKIQYMFAIIKSNIKKITDKGKMSKIKVSKPLYEDIEYISEDNTIRSNKRKSLFETLGGSNG